MVYKQHIVVGPLLIKQIGWHLQILTDQLTLSQRVGADYAHHITTGTPGFSDLPRPCYIQLRFHQHKISKKYKLGAFTNYVDK